MHPQVDPGQGNEERQHQVDQGYTMTGCDKGAHDSNAEGCRSMTRRERKLVHPNFQTFQFNDGFKRAFSSDGVFKEAHGHRGQHQRYGSVESKIIDVVDGEECKGQNKPHGKKIRPKISRRNKEDIQISPFHILIDINDDSLVQSSNLLYQILSPLIMFRSLYPIQRNVNSTFRLTFQGSGRYRREDHDFSDGAVESGPSRRWKELANPCIGEGFKVKWVKIARQGVAYGEIP